MDGLPQLYELLPAWRPSLRRSVGDQALRDRGQPGEPLRIRPFLVREHAAHGQAADELGKQGLVVSAMDLGCMGMSEFYGQQDDAEAIATSRTLPGAVG